MNLILYFLFHCIFYNSVHAVASLANLFKNYEKTSVLKLLENTNLFISLQLEETLFQEALAAENATLNKLYVEYHKALKDDRVLNEEWYRKMQEQSVILKQLEKTALDNLKDCLTSDPGVTTELSARIKKSTIKSEENNQMIEDFWECPVAESLLVKISFFDTCYREYWLEVARGYEKNCPFQLLKSKSPSFHEKLIKLLELGKPKKQNEKMGKREEEEWKTQKGSKTIAIGFAVFVCSLVIFFIVVTIALRLREKKRESLLKTKNNA